MLLHPEVLDHEHARVLVAALLLLVLVDDGKLPLFNSPNAGQWNEKTKQTILGAGIELDIMAMA